MVFSNKEKALMFTSPIYQLFLLWFIFFPPNNSLRLSKSQGSLSCLKSMCLHLFLPWLTGYLGMWCLIPTHVGLVVQDHAPKDFSASEFTETCFTAHTGPLLPNVRRVLAKNGFNADISRSGQDVDRVKLADSVWTSTVPADLSPWALTPSGVKHRDPHRPSLPWSLSFSTLSNFASCLLKQCIIFMIRKQSKTKQFLLHM